MENQNENNSNATYEAAPPEREQLPTSIDVKIHAVHTSGSVLANASVNLNGCFAIRGVKVVNGKEGPFVSMPSYKSQGEYKDVCFPCTKEFRQQFNDAVIAAYHEELVLLSQRGQQNNGQSQDSGGMGMAM